ncbi:RNAse III [Halanaerobium saccharolyticum]|uniref:Ribonuclease 3 n=1 Tax=Halanaerobium saccharolyticum TaxID=43595 RepID=A0A4R7YU54_9FIRM|nr:ribonuclease III [Halanaerobium saccharolyticum]RAK06201.1 RNAse III [Halanaerobium saccharolyticum]TDW00566.1 RNAse III [Halanaerobium saccharolyticum]TDX52231.1 RNAse III [Halanaerobium saccharolyticum]
MRQLFNKGKIEEFEESLALDFNDKNLIQRALTHKSYPNENRRLNLKDNERLEFLGDSVLSLSVSTYIFNKFSNLPEGELAKMRAVIVSAPILADVAKRIELGQFLFLGKGEEMTGGRERDSILADTMEAIFGALYLDQGFTAAADFILELLKVDIINVAEGNHIQDYKTILQEVIQENGNVRPEYEVVDEEGPDHNKTFIVAVKLNEDSLGSGQGSSKKEAEQEAAKVALDKLNKLD